MAQVVVYGHRSALTARREAISEAIHGADFIHPADRGTDYTIIEISLFEGRSQEARRMLIRELFTRLEESVAIAPHDVEITVHESPKVNWGIRGVNGADLALGYRVDV